MKKEISFENMSEITVCSQDEFDMIPDDFAGRIYINFGSCFNRAIINRAFVKPVVARENSSVVARENSSVVARENSSVEAWGNSSVEAWGNSSVVARENSSVEAWGNSSVEAWENSSVEAWENSSVEAWRNSSVEAWGNSSVVARENSSVEARENSSVVARENSSVEARENSSVEARENSSVEARENSSVEARGNSSVVARENSSVVARENSSVEAWGNTQVVNGLDGLNGRIKINGNSRIVYMPKTINEFMSFYGIKHDKKKAVFFKAVHRTKTGYISDYDPNFEYKIGVIVHNECDSDIHDICSYGIHISHLMWALNFGRNWKDIAIIEVETEIDKIVMPACTDGKVRTSEIKVLREVPLEECGVYGRIIQKRIEKKEND